MLFPGMRSSWESTSTWMNNHVWTAVPSTANAWLVSPIQQPRHVGNMCPTLLVLAMHFLQRKVLPSSWKYIVSRTKHKHCRKSLLPLLPFRPRTWSFWSSLWLFWLLLLLLSSEITFRLRIWRICNQTPRFILHRWRHLMHRSKVVPNHNWIPIKLSWLQVPSLRFQQAKPILSPTFLSHHWTRSSPLRIQTSDRQLLVRSSWTVLIVKFNRRIEQIK